MSFSSASIMAATGIRTLVGLTAAETQLEDCGLIRIKRLPNGDKQITLLEPGTGKPMQFPKRGE